MTNEVENKLKKYFTVRYVSDKTDNNLGLVQAFKTLIPLIKLRPVTKVRYRYKPYPTAVETSVLIACYSPKKLKLELEKYLNKNSLILEEKDLKKINLLKILELIKDKIKENEDVAIFRD